MNNHSTVTSTKKIVKIVLIGLGMVLVGVGGFWGYQEAVKAPPLKTSERDAAVEKILGHKGREESDIPAGNGQYDGKYLSFSYPAAAKIFQFDATVSPKLKGTLDRFSIDLYQPRRDFMLGVFANEADLQKIDEYPAVTLRKSQSKIYTQLLVTADGIEGISFTKESDGYEKTAFFLVKNRVYSFAVTGSSKKDVFELLDQILSSVKFK